MDELKNITNLQFDRNGLTTVGFTQGSNLVFDKFDIERFTIMIFNGQEYLGCIDFRDNIKNPDPFHDRILRSFGINVNSKAFKILRLHFNDYDVRGIAKRLSISTKKVYAVLEKYEMRENINVSS